MRIDGQLGNQRHCHQAHHLHKRGHRCRNTALSNKPIVDCTVNPEFKWTRKTHPRDTEKQDKYDQRLR